MNDRGHRPSFPGLGLAPLVVASLAIGATCGGGGDNFPELTPFPATLEERVHAIRDRVGEVRGLPITDGTVEGLLAREVYRQYVEDEASKIDEDERRELAAFNIAFRLLHLIGPEDDLLEAFTDFQAEDVVGLYFPKKERLVLIGEPTTIQGDDELILAHEYVHALQHESFDFDRFEDLFRDEDDGKTNTEYGTTIDCLQEGDASFAAAEYAEAAYGPDWVETLYPEDGDEEKAEEGESDGGTAPPALERYFHFNYSECPWFVSYLHREDGWEAVDRAYDDPPLTTEQILHPEKYLEKEISRNVKASDLSENLGDDWDRLHLGTFGEFDLYNYLATIVGDEWMAAQAAEGWGSGWVAVYTAERGNAAEDQDVLVQVTLDWDSELDFAEFLSVYGEVLDIVSDSNWRAEGPDGPVRWQGEAEYGYLGWDERLARVDIIISNDQEALEAAIAD